MILVGMAHTHAHEEEYPLRHYRKLRKIVRRKKAEVEESAENSFNIDAINDVSQDEIVETDSEEDDTETDGFFLQPVPIKLRRSLLKLSGVKKLDISEKDECKQLRGSREVCGCDCETICHPDTCQCAQNGIQCQVDRYSFPCGCTKAGCENPSGRIEFNPAKVRKHYQHTMYRLQQEEEEEAAGSPDSRNLGYSSVKRTKHIRFSDDGDAVAGEISFNSTDTGCCLDCSLTFPSSSHSDRDNQFDMHNISVHNSSDLTDKTDHQFTMFGSESSVYPNMAGALSPPQPSLTVSSYHETEEEELQPISGLLNPILNTVDSLDMYALHHLQHHHTQVIAANGSNSNSEDVVTEWQDLSHESMLTTNNLIPVKDTESSSDSSAAGADSGSSSSPPSCENGNGKLVMTSITTKTTSTAISLQLANQDENATDSLNSDFSRQPSAVEVDGSS